MLGVFAVASVVEGVAIASDGRVSRTFKRCFHTGAVETSTLLIQILDVLPGHSRPVVAPAVAPKVRHLKVGRGGCLLVADWAVGALVVHG